MSFFIRFTNFILQSQLYRRIFTGLLATLLHAGFFFLNLLVNLLIYAGLFFKGSLFPGLFSKNIAHINSLRYTG